MPTRTPSLDCATMLRISEQAKRHLIALRPGPGVCRDCFNLTRGFERCYACAAGEQHLAAVVPISYCLAGEPLHSALAAYKREAEPFVADATIELAAILWRFLDSHERCIADAAHIQRFDLVTTVPAGDRTRETQRRQTRHPLDRIVAELIAPTRDRCQHLLERTAKPAPPRRFDLERFAATRPLNGEPILLIDDMWTSGASAQSAAAALLAAGSGPVAAVVIGRYLNPGWDENTIRLCRRRGSFDFAQCPVCAAAASRSAA